MRWVVVVWLGRLKKRERRGWRGMDGLGMLVAAVDR